MDLKNILYTGVMISTFSPGVVSFRTVDDMAGTTPVQKIRLSLSILSPWRLSHHEIYASFHSSGMME